MSYSWLDKGTQVNTRMNFAGSIDNPIALLDIINSLEMYTDISVNSPTILPLPFMDGSKVSLRSVEAWINSCEKVDHSEHVSIITDDFVYWRGVKDSPTTIKTPEINAAMKAGKKIQAYYADIKEDEVNQLRPFNSYNERDEDGEFRVRGSLNLFSCNVYSRVDLSCINFEENLRLERVRFHNEVYFNYSKFKKTIAFNDVHFLNDTEFDSAHFYGDTFFQEVRFNETVSFKDATFEEPLIFSSTARKRINFDYARFSGVSFSGTTFNWNARFIGTVFNGYAWFTNTSFLRNATFAYARFNDITDFLDARFKYPADFHELYYYENTALKGIWNDILRPLLSRILLLARMKNLKLPRSKVTVFMSLNTEKVIDTSTNPCLKRYIDDEQWIESWKNRNRWKKLLYIGWELTSHCGRSILLWTLWSFVIALSFGVLYSANPSWFQETMGILSPWYFSVVTFTTLGFGDVTPDPHCWQGQVWIMAEVILGYLMLGGLISIFANKFAKRS